MFIFIASFITSFAIALGVTPLVIRLANIYQLVDDPKKRYHPAHTHKGIVPRAGGLVLFLAIILSMVVFIDLDRRIVSILAGMFLIVLVGTLDDYFDISPYIRFILNFITASFVLFGGIAIYYITNPFGGVIHFDKLSWNLPIFSQVFNIPILPIVITLIWIVWMMNAVGWSAGVDGQFPGFIVIASIVIAILSQRFVYEDPSQIQVTLLSFITAGAYTGFLYWNFYPQKIMPGYGGKSLAGFLLAVLSIMSGAKVGTALLVLGVPLADAFYTVVRRIAQKKSPFRADRGHLHHRLLDMGWGKRRIALFYWIISAVLGSAALIFQSPGKLFVFLLVFVFVGGLLISLRFFNFFRIRS